MLKFNGHEIKTLRGNGYNFKLAKLNNHIIYEKKLESGLYRNGSLYKTWDELKNLGWISVAQYGSDVTRRYISSVSNQSELYDTLVIDEEITDVINIVNQSDFSKFSNLVEIVFPDTLKYTVSGGSSSPTLPNGTLKKVTIPGDVRFSHLFNQVTSLEEITITGGLTGVGFNFSSFYNSTPWYKSLSNLLKVTIKKSLTSIGNSMFYYFRPTHSVQFIFEGDSIGFDENAFCFHNFSSIGGKGSGCDLEIPLTITSMGSWVFRSNTLTKVDIGDVSFPIVDITQSVSNVPHGWFSRASSSGDILHEVRIPINIPGYCLYCFSTSDYRTKIEKITYTKGVSNYELNYTSTSNKVNYYGYGIYQSRSTLNEMIFEEGIETLGEYIFYSLSGGPVLKMDFSRLTTLKTIKNRAFYLCQKINNNTPYVEIPSTVETVYGTDTFQNVNFIYRGTATGSPWGGTNYA